MDRPNARDPDEVDLVPFNDPAILNQTRLGMSAAGLVLVAAGVVAGLVPYLALVLHGGAWTATNNPGFDLFVFIFLGGIGGLFLVTSFAGGTELATPAQVDATGLQFRYPSGRLRAFRWTDPKLNLRILDHIGKPGHPYAYQRRVVLWRPFTDRTNMPPEFLDLVSKYAADSGVLVKVGVHQPTGGRLIRFSRRGLAN